MHITQINVQGLEFESAAELLKGCVALISGTNRVQVDCAVHDSAETPPEMRPSVLITEAIRQLRRMPEYRGGKIQVSFADELGMVA